MDGKKALEKQPSEDGVKNPTELIRQLCESGRGHQSNPMRGQEVFMMEPEKDAIMITCWRRWLDRRQQSEPEPKEKRGEGLRTQSLSPEELAYLGERLEKMQRHLALRGVELQFADLCPIDFKVS
ncbi:MAG: hypothetical protein V3S39_07925 [Thermodesulfobacteriota bacterium]